MIEHAVVRAPARGLWPARLRRGAPPASSADAASGAAPCPTCDDGLIAHWPLDDTGTTAHDVIAGHDGSVVGETAWGPGRIGGALGVTDGYVEIDNWDVTTPALHALTIAEWIQPTSGFRQNNDRYFASYWWDGNSHGALEIDSDNNGVGLRCVFDIGGEWTFAEVDVTVPADSWSHIACVYDGAMLTAYLDGVAYQPQAVTGALKTTVELPLVIGGGVEPGDSQNLFDGSIDDVRIYDRALGSAELAELAL